MSPKIDKYSAGVRVDRTEQGAQCIVETDNENRRADRLQVLRHKTHPKFFAVVPELAVRNVEDDFVVDLCPLSIVRKENKLSCGVNKMLDQPRTCDPVDLDFFTGNPFHGPTTRRSCPSPASYCSAKHRHGRELLSLRLRSSACFCCLNRISFVLNRAGIVAHCSMW